MNTAYHLAYPLEWRIDAETMRRAFPTTTDSLTLLSGGHGEHASRTDSVSYFAARPAATFRARRSRDRLRDPDGRLLADVETTYANGPRERTSGTAAFEALDRFASAFQIPATVPDERYPFKLSAGLIGYIGYESGQFLESLGLTHRPSMGLPDIAFGYFPWVIATPRCGGQSWLSVVGRGETSHDAQTDAMAVADHVLAEVRLSLGSKPQAPVFNVRASGMSIEPSLKDADYKERIRQAISHIAKGDAFEICLTKSVRVELPRSFAWPLFTELAHQNASPFAAYLEWPEATLVSSSPERFLSLGRDRIAETRPIKGTRPRGRTPEEDESIRAELATSEKDRAENAMIVDLARNDLGRVCDFGSVKVPELFAVESFATVHQLVSTVQGTMAKEARPIDLLASCFPPGSMTGAPKLEAMKILETLEPCERGPYAGALGWWSVAGAMDFSVIIRTMILTDEASTLGVGGAVVFDSDPEAELNEANHKSVALLAAARRVRGIDS